MNDNVIYVETDKLHVHPENESYFNDIGGDEYKLFKKSIEKEGIINPLLVAYDMTIISGHQRYRAALDLKLDTVPVIIDSDIKTENDKLRVLLASNFGRNKNNPIKQSRAIIKYEELLGIKRGNPKLLKDAPKKTQEDIANELGISVDTLKRLKNLQKLDPEIQDLIEKGNLNYTTALKVFAVLPKSDQIKIIKSLTGINLSKLTASQLKDYISENASDREKLFHYNTKIRSICTHMNREIAMGSSSLSELYRKCSGEITDRNKKYICTVILSMQEQLKNLKDIYTGGGTSDENF